MDLTTIALLVLAPLLIWRIYSRLKTTMARQRSILQKHYTGLGLFTAMALVPATELMGKPMSLLWLALGLAAGIGYGIWGLRLTRYETTAQGYFFTPNARLGIFIAMLFIARLLYVGVELYANQNSAAPRVAFTDRPFTMLALGVVAGYFATMSAGLLRWRRALKKAVDAGAPK
ncbi:MAG: hypothetical protein V4857_09790 [Pseudomonadota bacterium]